MVIRSTVALASFALGALVVQAEPDSEVDDINTSAAEHFAELVTNNAPTSAQSAAQSSAKQQAIRERIKSLHVQQAQYLEKVASEGYQPNAHLQQEWPKIQSEVLTLRDLIASLNGLEKDAPERTEIESQLLVILQRVGSYLVPADHPEFPPHLLTKQDVSEISRIQSAIADMSYGDRDQARPVQVRAPFYEFTLINLPLPVVLKSQPGEVIYLTADSGGLFDNGLPTIELQADDEGMAKTHWHTRGEAVGPCRISVFSASAIESQFILFNVVSPCLKPMDGLPEPDPSLLRPSSSISPSKVSSFK